MFIDIHAHITRQVSFCPNGKNPYATVEQLIARYDALGIEKGVLLPEVNPEIGFSLQTNEDILELAALYPDRLIPFCNIDPRAKSQSCQVDFAHVLRYYRDKGCKGFGEICACLEFLDPMVQNLFKYLEDAGFPVTFHLAAQLGNGTYGLYDQPGLPQLETCLQRFPKLNFLAHSQTFWAEIGVLENVFDRYSYPRGVVKGEGAVPRLLRKYPNLYGDLSAGSGYNALARDRSYAIKFMNEFQDQLLFGTDICAPDTPVPLVDFMLELRKNHDISEDVFYKIAKLNARKILNL